MCVKKEIKFYFSNHFAFPCLVLAQCVLCRIPILGEVAQQDHQPQRRSIY